MFSFCKNVLIDGIDSNLRSTLIDIKGVAQHIRDTSVNDTFELHPKQLQQL